jgi:hypothetical protein
MWQIFFKKVSKNVLGKNLEKLVFQCKIDFLSKIRHFCKIENTLELKHWMSEWFWVLRK